MLACLCHLQAQSYSGEDAVHYGTHGILVRLYEMIGDVTRYTAAGYLLRELLQPDCNLRITAKSALSQALFVQND